MFALGRNKKRRKKKVKDIFQLLPSRNVVRSLNEPDDLPRISLHGALERFVIGAYDDCVFHSAFSVEMALLLRLDSQLDIDQKDAMRREATRNKAGLMFSKIIDMSKEKSILKGDSVQKAWKLNSLRNMYAHPANWVAFVKQNYGIIGMNIKKEMPDVYAIAEKSFASFTLPSVLLKRAIKMLGPSQKKVGDYVRRLEKIPNLDWCASQDTLGFQNKRMKEYVVDMVRAISSQKGLMDLVMHRANLVAYAQSKFPYDDRDAYEALVLAFEILRDLKVIK